MFPSWDNRRAPHEKLHNWTVTTWQCNKTNYITETRSAPVPDWFSVITIGRGRLGNLLNMFSVQRTINNVPHSPGTSCVGPCSSWQQWRQSVIQYRAAYIMCASPSHVGLRALNELNSIHFLPSKGNKLSCLTNHSRYNIIEVWGCA